MSSQLVIFDEFIFFHNKGINALVVRHHNLYAQTKKKQGGCK